MTKQRTLDVGKRAVRAYLSVWARLVLHVRTPLIVGVTGSVGKTTTKEVLAAVLSHRNARPFVGIVRKSPGNLNDNLGLPLAILGFPDWHSSVLELVWWLCVAPLRALKLAFVGTYADVLVLEYALGSESDFSRSVRVAPPTVAVVTAIGPAHLEAFGTLERIAFEKGRLVRAVPPAGLVVLGSENPFLSDMSRQASARVVTVEGTGRALAANVGRALAANVGRAVGAFFGIPQEVAEDAIRHRPAVRRRLKFHDLGPITLIDDTINANPMSMELALRTLAEHKAASRRSVAVLGFMAELGAQAAMYHEQVGLIARAHADVIVGVGPLAEAYGGHHWFATAQECAEQLGLILSGGDLVLVKGSAAAQMELVTGEIKRLAREWSGVAA